MAPGLDEAFIAARREELLEVQRELSGRSRDALHHIMAQEREVGDSVDNSTEERGTSTMLRFKGRERATLYLVERALLRIEDEEYGECVECGVDINPRRLQVNPMAELCIDCQGDLEKQQKQNAARPGMLDEYM